MPLLDELRQLSFVETEDKLLWSERVISSKDGVSGGVKVGVDDPVDLRGTHRCSV